MDDKNRRENMGLYRGRDKDDGKWYQGNYLKFNDTTYCFQEDYDRHPENTKHYIGFELDKHYCDIANERIQKAVAEKAVGE